MDVRCDFQEDSYAINAAGDIVLCPDFPDLVLAKISEKNCLIRADLKRAQIISLLGGHLKMGICYSCCHNKS